MKAELKIPVVDIHTKATSRKLASTVSPIPIDLVGSDQRKRNFLPCRLTV
jgi:hypothetical protein